MSKHRPSAAVLPEQLLITGAYSPHFPYATRPGYGEIIYVEPGQDLHRDW